MFSLAVLFFLVGHLIESTVIGLELYFEHRNYLPAAFLFLPIASGLDMLGQRIGRTIPTLIALLIISLLASLTWTRANLWADNDRLELYWATSATDSPRAQNALATYYWNQGLIEKAQRHIEEASLRLPNSSLLTMRLLLQKVWVHQATEADFALAAQRLAVQPFDAQTVKALRTLVEQVVEAKTAYPVPDGLPTTARQSSRECDLQQISAVSSAYPLSQGSTLPCRRPAGAGVGELTDAMARYNDTDAALQMVALMANSGHIDQSLRLLDQAETLYRQQPDRTLKRSRTIYDQEIARLRTLLNDVRATP